MATVSVRSASMILKLPLNLNMSIQNCILSQSKVGCIVAGTVLLIYWRYSGVLHPWERNLLFHTRHSIMLLLDP